MKKGQLSIEFIMMLVVSFALLFTFAAVMQTLATQKNQQKTYEEINNLGVSLQAEFLLASELEDGYSRVISVPETVNGLEYSIFNGNASGNSTNAYIEITFLDLGLGYNIPTINGTIQKGDNVLTKVDGWLVLN